MKSSTVVLVILFSFLLLASGNFVSVRGSDARADGPAISSVYGNATEGGVLTITGTNFGDKDSAEPQVWDDLEDGKCDLNATIGHWGSTNVLEISNNTTVQRTPFSRYAAHYNFQGTATAGFRGVNDVLSRKWFVQYWVYLDEDWEWGTGTYGSDDEFLSNVKYFRLWNPSSNVTENFYVQFWWALDGNSYSNVEHVAPVNNFDIPFSKSNLTKGEWHLLQFEFRDSSQPGASDAEFRFWGDGKLHEDRTDFIARNTTFLKRPFFIGFFNAWGDGNGHDNDYYMDDIYVDTTWARVEIGDSANYGNCTHREIQIPTAWSDDRITIQFNQGSFENGDTVYVFVVDENGTVSDGYPVVIGNAVPELSVVFLPLLLIAVPALVIATRFIHSKS